MNDLLQDKVCLVTGATRGIGRAIALALANQGGIVWGTATSSQGAEIIEETFKEHGLQGYGRVLDVCNEETISSLIAEITETSGATTVLVNNAAITRDNLLIRMSQEDWNGVIQTNLDSVYLLSKAVVRPMAKARHGRIVNISSVIGVSGNAGQSNYAAAKAGVIGFSKSLAQELAPRGITVNAVAPGFIDTDMTRALSEAQSEAIMAKIPMGRMGSTSEIADTVVFLASDMASYITGSTLHVNGGMLTI